MVASTTILDRISSVGAMPFNGGSVCVCCKKPRPLQNGHALEYEDMFLLLPSTVHTLAIQAIKQNLNGFLVIKGIAPVFPSYKNATKVRTFTFYLPKSTENLGTFLLQKDAANRGYIGYYVDG